MSELNDRRRAAWSELYRHARLEVTQWAELATELDRIIDEALGEPAEPEE